MREAEEKQRPRGEAEPRGRERVGGGPYAPGGDTEPGNLPGEAREEGLKPPTPEPVLPSGTEVEETPDGAG